MVLGIIDRDLRRIDKRQFSGLFLGSVFQIIPYCIGTAEIAVHTEGNGIQHLFGTESVQKRLQQPELVPGIPGFFFPDPLQELRCPTLQLFIQTVLKFIQSSGSVPEVALVLDEQASAGTDSVFAEKISKHSEDP